MKMEKPWGKRSMRFLADGLENFSDKFPFGSGKDMMA